MFKEKVILKAFDEQIIWIVMYNGFYNWNPIQILKLYKNVHEFIHYKTYFGYLSQYTLDTIFLFKSTLKANKYLKTK